MIVVLLVTVAIGAGVIFWQSYNEARRASQNQVDSAAQVVAANAAWLIVTARQVLGRVDDIVGPDLATVDPDAVGRLREATSTLPGNVKLYVVGADGITRLTTDPDFRPIDVRDREYFAALAEGDDFHVTPMLISRLNDEQIFVLSKRIERDGAFAGAAIVSLNSEFVKSIWSELHLDPLSTVSLVRDDGQLISRYPLPAGPVDLSGTPMITQADPSAESGFYQAASTTDGIDRMVGYRRVPGTNLIAAASLSTERAFAGFRATTFNLLVLVLPAALALAALSFWTYRLLKEDAVRRQTEAQFRVLAEVMPNHVWTARPDGLIDWLNSRVDDYAGTAPGSLVGTGWSSIVHPDDLPEVAARWSEAVSSGQLYEAEFRVRRADGHHRWFIARAMPLTDDKGAVVRWIGTNTDIDEQKRVAAALAESQARLDMAIESGQIAVWEIDAQTGRVAHSPALNRLYGFPDDAEPSLDQFRSRYAPGEAERIDAMSREAEARGESGIEAEVRHLMPDGSEKWMLLRARMLPAQPGAAARALGVAIDITARKHIEQALAQSEQRFRLSQHAAGPASIELDLATRLVQGSDYFWTLWGLPRQGSIHADLLEQIVVPEDRHLLFADAALETAPATVEYRIRRPDTGELRWLARHSELIADARGRPVRMFGIMQDVTDRKEAEARQTMLTHELEHRIKNILAMVSAIASQTLRDGDIGVARNTFNERIRALATAHDILTGTRWTNASLRSIITSTTALLPGERIGIAGPDVPLPPKMSLSLALAVHELGTNALKYGALSNTEGRVAISWTIGRDAEGVEILTWTWRERGGPAVTPPDRKGFGSFLIARVLGADFGGSVSIDYAPEGLSVVLTAPVPSSKPLRPATKEALHA